MKPGTYTHGPASCNVGHSQAVPAHLRGRLLEISSLLVPEEHRNQGHARDLIDKICQNADVDRVCLMVMVDPFAGASSGPDKEALAAWYARRFAFFCLQDSPALLMLRLPYGAQPVRD